MAKIDGPELLNQLVFKEDLHVAFVYFDKDVFEDLLGLRLELQEEGDAALELDEVLCGEEENAEALDVLFCY